MNRIGRVMFPVLAIVALAGCAGQPQRQGGYGYQQGPSRNYCYDHCGVVRDVEQIYVQKNDATLGTVLGAVIGGALGNQVGEGRGRTAATIGGAVIGGAIGNSVGSNNGNQVPVWRILIRLDNGRLGSVTQREYPNVRSGDYVEIRDGRVYRR
jgi:outer membrane lipoprotein SlyB